MRLTDEIKQKLPLLTLVRHHIGLARKGDGWWGLCPFHEEKTPSFMLKDNEDFFYCFGCSSHGDIFDFYMQVAKVEFSQALTFLAQQAGVSLDKYHSPQLLAQRAVEKKCIALISLASKLFNQELLQTPSVLHYLHSRHITDEEIHTFHLGYAPPNFNSISSKLIADGYTLQDMCSAGLLKHNDRNPYKSQHSYHSYFQNRLIFTLHNRQGQPVGFAGRLVDEKSKANAPKYLNSPSTIVFEKSASLYNYHRLRQQLASKASSLQEVFIAEGYFDVIALTKLNCNAVCAMGTAMNAQQLQLAWDLCHKVVIIFDGDEAGQKATLRLVEKALAILQPGYHLDVIVLPHDLDPDQLYIKGQHALLAKQRRSLLDYLWQVILQEAHSNSPQAAPMAAIELASILEGKIRKYTELIEDHPLRKLYSRLLRQKMFAFLPRTSRSSPASSFSSAKGSYNLRAQIVLCYLLHYPSLIADYYENLLGLKWGEPLDSYKNLLLSIALAYEEKESTLSANQLKEELQSHTSLLQQLTEPNFIFCHCRHILNQADSSSIKAELNKIFSLSSSHPLLNQ